MKSRFGPIRLVPLLFGLEMGCGGAHSGALGPLREGHLPAAALELRAREHDFPRLSPGARARYALYRGLAELGLGNARVADHWLSLARRADLDDALYFDASERGQLFSAWRSLGRMPGERR